MSSFLDWVAKNYGEKPGKMLIHTGVIGWILSSLAQTVAIATNDKISREQKSFLIPQELADAMVNIVSFYAITQSVSSLTKKMVKTGKLLPKSVREFFSKKEQKLGDWNTNVKELLTKNNATKEITGSYNDFHNGADVIATTVGSIISCNIVTPIIRNNIAAHGQKNIMNKYDSKNKSSYNTTYKAPRINDYMGNSGSNMKI